MIDVGAFDGYSTEQFKSLFKDDPNCVLLEPIKEYAEQLIIKYKNDDTVKVICAGAYSCNGKIGFDDTSDPSARVSKDSSETIDIVTIDSLEIYKRVTFIKMDIEGSELEALKGAVKVITRDRPRLAICIYHKDSDFLDIPEFLHNIVPEYRFWVRHHGKTSFLETVLYAQV